MSDKKLTTFLTALDKLESRPIPLTGKAGRGREAPLFKALSELSPSALKSAEGKEAIERLLSAFLERLGDAALLPSMLDLFGARPDFGKDILRRISERESSDDRWGVERCLKVESGEGIKVFEELKKSLTEDSKDWPLEKAKKMLTIRSRTPVSRRDPVSTKLCEKALARLTQSLDDETARDWIVKTITWETARAGKEEPTLALAAIESLKQFPPVLALRAIKPLLTSIKRRVCVQRLEKIKASCREEMGLPDEQLNDVMAPALKIPDWISFDIKGRLQVSIGKDNPDYSLGFERQCQREADRVIEQWTTRLDGALTNQELWPMVAWKAIFAESGCPARQNLCQRLVWRGLEEVGADPIYMRWNGSQLCDVFNEPLKLKFEYIGLAHPLRMEKDELNIWRDDLLETGYVQPFPQLFRLFFPKAPMDKFTGCFFPSDPPRLGRSRSYKGLPLRGRSKEYEVTRKFGENEVTIWIGGSEQRIQSISWEFDPNFIQESEVARDLFDMIGASFFGDHAYWNQWNSELKMDNKNTWNKALALYKRAPKRLPAMRLKILKSILPSLPGHESVRCEGRFVIIDGEDGGIVELGSGNQHVLNHRSFVPPRDHTFREVDLPHERSTDPQLDRILGLIAYLAERVQKATAKNS